MIGHFATAFRYFAYVMICMMSFEATDTVLEGVVLFGFTFGALHFSYLLDPRQGML